MSWGGGAYIWRGLFSEFYGNLFLGTRLVLGPVSRKARKFENQHLLYRGIVPSSKTSPFSSFSLFLSFSELLNL